MSGGHWNFSGNRIRMDLSRIAEDSITQKRWPLIAELMKMFSEQLYEIEHEMDWDVCLDSQIENDQEFDLSSVGALLDSILRVLPDSVFERGKWATIQNWQRLTGSEDSGAFKIREALASEEDDD